MKTTIAVVGFGDRSEQYTKYVLKHPEEGEVTAVVDPSRLPCRSCGWGTTCCWKNRSRAIKRSSWRWKGRQRLADAG